MKIVVITATMLLNIFNACLESNAEQILVKGGISFLSCQKIYDTNFLLYSKNSDSFGEIFVKEFNLDWQERREKKLGINGASAHLAYFNNRFYVFYTSFEKDGKAHIAEFDMDFNLQRDIQLNPATYGGEWAYKALASETGNSLYFFYARNWGTDCGLKAVEFSEYLHIIKEVTFIKGNTDFHNDYSEFSPVFADNRIYIAYKKSSSESMDVFVDEYNTSGELIRQRCIARKEKLWPALFFDIDRFYLVYDSYDEQMMQPVIYAHQYDKEWSLLKQTKIILQETGMPRPKTIIAYTNKCYLVALSQVKQGESKIFLKELDFDLTENKTKKRF